MNPPNPSSSDRPRDDRRTVLRRQAPAICALLLSLVPFAACGGDTQVVYLGGPVRGDASGSDAAATDTFTRDTSPADVDDGATADTGLDEGVAEDGAAQEVDEDRPADDWNQAWADMELEVIRETNRYRAQPQVCGAQSFDAAPPLRFQEQLRESARGHSQDMAEQGFFDHISLDGRDPGDRISATGYDFSTYGENIAAGQTTAAEVVLAWLESPGHCANMMEPGFTRLGVGYFQSRSSEYTHYWTQNFGAP